MRWQHMSECKEKYAAYLCSREWSVLKEAVKERSNGMCERCAINAMDHVHHMTYARKYAERIEDLQACCKPCHEFIHGKSDFDPAQFRPVIIPWCKSKVKTFYLAGKITGTAWRDEIVAGWSDARSTAYANAVEDRLWLSVGNVTTACGVSLDYCGPWWKDLSGGHASSTENSHPHACGDPFQVLDDYWERQYAEDRLEVSRNVHRTICGADMLFAWIDSADCYGTIYEIGLARAQRKVVVVAVSKAFQIEASDMWLAFEGCYCVIGECAREAWDEFWDLVAFGDKPSLCVGAENDGGRLARSIKESLQQPCGFHEQAAFLESLVAVLRLTQRGTISLADGVHASQQERTHGAST